MQQPLGAWMFYSSYTLIKECSCQQTLVVVHTSEWTSPTEIKVRIISARKADHVELHDYENVPR